SLLVSCLAGSVLFALGAVAFGAHYRPAVLQAIPALAIVLLSLVGIAFLVASVNLVAKRANFMVDSISYLLVVTSGVLFPLSVMPVVFKAIGLLLPVTYSLDLLRAGALGSRPFLPVAQEYLVLSGLGLALLVAGRWVFLKTERRLRTEGSLGFH
ncbi:MAG TPA: ABC transporter permease, partial [Chloroflexota bacterium]|nr:ABC transporter permease [Chloroflexota bacterium]